MRWTKEEDNFLTEVIFNHLRNKKSATNGIIAAQKKIPHRTIESCKSRWNTKLKYEHAIELKEIKDNNQKS